MIRITAFLTALIALANVGLAQFIEVDAELPFRPEGRPLEGLVITIDPGHGGSAHQPGYSGSARGVGSRAVEGDLNMLVGGLLRHHLRRAGATVHMTRWDDRKVTLGDSDRATELGARVALAEETRSHLFLALHHNSAPRATADGVVVLIWPTDSEGEEQPLETAFADCLREEVEAQVHHTEEFPHYINEHPLVADSEIPSAVIEFGFLSNAEFDAWVSQRGTHVAEARGIYNAVVRMWTEHREELETLRDQLFPREEVTEAPSSWRARNSVRGVARRLWPVDRPPETAAEAQHIIDMYRGTVLSDSTFFHLDARVEPTDDGWQLTGSANHPMVRRAVANILEAAGCEPLDNALETLPSERLGEERYGVVQIPMALTYFAPGRGTAATQLLLGERVWLLDISEDGEQLLHMASDGYVGWVRREAIRRMGAEEFAHWQLAPRARVVRETMIDDLRLPTGAALPLITVNRDTATLRLPMGVRATEGLEEVEVPLEAITLPPEEPLGRAAALTAVDFLTIPYVFGGRSALGLDCSGLSGIAYQTHGFRLPRDARQQILVGELVATPWRLGPFRPGDLLFFCSLSGRISHEAVSLGGMRFIHAANPQVYIGSLDPDDPLYIADYARRFAFARRPVE